MQCCRKYFPQNAKVTFLLQYKVRKVVGESILFPDIKDLIFYRESFSINWLLMNLIMRFNAEDKSKPYGKCNFTHILMHLQPNDISVLPLSV